MASRPPDTFATLRSILAEHASSMEVTADTSEEYALDTPYAAAYDRPLFFGAVRVAKRYVGFHLMPVYIYPDLLDDLPDLLRSRMHGKSCFNFKEVSPEEEQALRELTEASVRRLREEGVLS